MADMIAEAGERLFAAHAAVAFAAMPGSAEEGATPWQNELWQAVEEAGFPLALLTEEDGGFDIPAPEALALVRIAAAHALPLPLAETMLANWLFAAAGLPLAEGPATLAQGLHLVPEQGGWRVSGCSARTPYGRHARVVAALATDDDGCNHLLRLEQGYTVTKSHNLAAEARDDLSVDFVLPEVAAAPASVTPEVFIALGATIRALALVGALEATLEKSIAYANERVQFGRPIGKFQAIQHDLAVMAAEVAAARAGAELAAALLPQASEGFAFTAAAAAAKIRAGEAAGTAAAIAHQVHGAFGFTREYTLHPLTRRLWAWREEYGTESFWCDQLGAAVCRLGPDGFWPFLTGTVQEAV